MAAAGVELFSTGGTRRHLEEQGLTVRDVAAYTGFPEMLDGRVKTLHPRIHAGILARHDRPDDLAALAAHDIASFELVVVNLYPFEATVARDGVTFDEAVEQIDIGGPSLIRAAAKNHAFVTVATDPAQYSQILDQVTATGSTTAGLRRALADAAFARTARYDACIAQYLAGARGAETFPEQWRVELRRKEVLRYGENPHQQAALYSERDAAQTANLVSSQQLAGKELSYNNLLDLDSALAIVRSLDGPSAVVIKHNNPCGTASKESLATAARAALDGDPQSAFGSVLGFNRPLDAATAAVLAEPERFVEAIVAPDFDAEALEILTTRPKWKASVRLMKAGSLDAPPAGWQLRQIEGGMLVQQADTQADPQSEWRRGHGPRADARAMGRPAIRLGHRAARQVERHRAGRRPHARGHRRRPDEPRRFGRNRHQEGRGSGPRIGAGFGRFFPFADSIQQAAAAGVAAIIQPGGSRRDDEVIAACNEHQLPMVFTGRRHFKH